MLEDNHSRDGVWVSMLRDGSDKGVHIVSDMEVIIGKRVFRFGVTEMSD